MLFQNIIRTMFLVVLLCSTAPAVLFAQTTIQPRDQIAVGAYHSVVLNDAGQVFTFGTGINGVLGQDQQDKRMDLARPLEVPVLDGKTIVDVAFAGNDSALILTDDGKVYGWGASSDYQFGSALQSVGPLHSPTLITHPALDTVKIIQISLENESSDRINSMMLTENGDVLVMGANDLRLIGIGSGIDVPGSITDPTPIDRTNLGDEKVVQLARSRSHSLFLTESNKVFAVGENSNGQLGINSTTTQFVAVQIPQVYFGDKTISSLYAAADFSYALATDGTLFSWGGQNRALGQGELSGNVLVPTQVTHSSLDAKAVASVSVSEQNTVMLTTTDGLVYVAGNNPLGILGIGTLDNAPLTSWTQVPPAKFDNKSIVEVSPGSTFSLFRASDGTLFGAGYNAGTGYDGIHTRPFPLNTTFIEGKTITRMITSNGDMGYGVLLDSDGVGYMFQNNQMPELILRRLSNPLVGRNINSIIDTPTLTNHANIDGKKVIDGALGFDGVSSPHYLILLEDHTMYGFGFNLNGGLGLGTFNSTNEPTPHRPG